MRHIGASAPLMDAGGSDAGVAGLRAVARAGVGRVVVGSLAGIVSLATCVRRPQPVLVRVDPDAHPRTGGRTFGLPIVTGEATAAVRNVLACPVLELVGLQCRAGSTGASDAVRTPRRRTSPARSPTPVAGTQSPFRGSLSTWAAR
ncbi:MAG: hypothetical protein L0K86_10270 [Actinomycetia bacterium]|nr:hypothetical protein [Actinomycetes bacterium]